MTTGLSSGFTQRIAAYPAVVQRTLQAKLTEADLRIFLDVLHCQNGASSDRYETILSQDLHIDTILSRLLRSNRFAASMAQFLEALEQSDLERVRSLATRFLAPLSDPNQPYLYKLSEFAADTTTPEEVSQKLVALQQLIALRHRILAGPRNGQQIVIREIMEAAETGTAPALSWILEALDAIGAQQGLGKPAAGPLSRAAGTAFVRVLFEELNITPLSQNDLRTLEYIARDRADASGLVSLSTPAPLTVVLSAPAPEETRQMWESYQDMGVIGATLSRADYDALEAAQKPAAVLMLPAASRISPILPAYLSCSGTDPLHLELNSRQKGYVSSWTRTIRGYSDSGQHDRVGDFLRGDAPGTANAQLEIALDLAPSLQSHPLATDGIAAEDCYAIVLRRGNVTLSEEMLNLDRCIIVDGFDALTARFAETPDMVRHKPVVIIGPNTQQTSGTIISAVQTYWAWTGMYPVTTNPIRPSFDGLETRFRLERSKQTALVGMVLSDQTALPLWQALELSPETRGRVERLGILLPPGGIAVHDLLKQASPANQADAAALNQILNTLDLRPEDAEALFLHGTLTDKVLQALSPVANWPIAGLINAQLQDTRDLDVLLRKFATTPNLNLAQQILPALADTASIRRFGPQLDAFAEALSAQPGIVSRLEDEPLLVLLRFARKTPALDRIAANMAHYAARICRGNRNHIIPLFELLATGLSKDGVNAALAFVASDSSLNKGARYRVAESIRRYGADDLQMQYLAQLSEAGSELLGETSFLRMFQRVLSSPQLPLLRNLVGPKVINLITSTLDFRDSFKHALTQRDRNTLQALVSDPDRLKNVDFLKWMDSLRSHSNELHEVQLSTQEVRLPRPPNLHASKLMAAVFSDVPALREFADNDLLGDTSDLSLIGQNILGNNAPLNAMLAKRFAGSGIPPLSIEGDSTAAVFTNAAQACRMPKTGQDGPRVSVIISAYNADIDLLKLSLTSVLEQTHDNIEVFVVDDASEIANSEEIRAAVANYPNVSYRRLDANSGPYVGRNLAIEAATGEFIAIQDADDWSHPDRFARQLAVFADNPTLQLVTTPHIRIDKYGRVQMEAEFSILGDGPMTSMFRRSVFDTVGPFANVRSRGDVEMRERIRGYCGSHALRELPLPMMLCFANSATLSQLTKSHKHEYLQLFRSNIEEHATLANLRRDGVPLGPDQRICVPLPLRPSESA